MPSPCDSAVGSAGRALALPGAVADAMRSALAAYGGRLVRWPVVQGVAIGVWVQPVPAGSSGGWPGGGASAPWASADWRWATYAGARAWDGVVPGLRFAPVRDSAGADVHVLWERARRQRARPAPAGPDERGRHPDGAHGHTAVVADRTGVIERADVTLGLPDPGDRGAAPASPRDVQAVAAHEFGHVLGLVHRAELRSAMAPAVRADDASARDRAVLRAWYALPAGLSCW